MPIFYRFFLLVLVEKVEGTSRASLDRQIITCPLADGRVGAAQVLIDDLNNDAK